MSNDIKDSLLADLDLIWHSTSDTRETNEALDRIKAALSAQPRPIRHSCEADMLSDCPACVADIRSAQPQPPSAPVGVEGDALTPSEAVTAFGAWLTCRPGTLEVGATHDAAAMADACAGFSQSQGLAPPRDHYHTLLKPYPVEAQAALSQQPAAVDEGVEDLSASLRDSRERMIAALGPKFGDAFDGDFDAMRDAADALSHLTKRADSARGLLARHLAQQPAAAEKTLSDALAYVGQRADGDLPTLAERCALWMRESKSLIDYRRHPPRPKGVATQQHAAVDEAATTASLRMMVGAATPVSVEIDPRGYTWSETYLDQALPAARAALAQPQGADND